MRFPSSHRWTLCVTPKSPKGGSKREFSPRGASDARVLAVIVCVCVCLCVCVSVTRRYCIKTAKRRITQTTPRDNQGSGFLTPRVVGGWPSSPEICAQTDPPLSNTTFWPISAHSASTARAGEKSPISINRKSTSRFPTSHRWTVYVTPKSRKRWHKTRFFCFCQ